MNFSLISIFFVSISVLAFFIAAKILTRDLKFNFKESIYLILASIILAISIIINCFLFTSGAVATNLIEESTLAILMFIYFFKVKFYSIKKSFILLFLVMLAIMVFETSWEAAALYTTTLVFCPYVQPQLAGAIVATLYTLGFYIVFVPSSFLFVKLSKNLRAIINGDVKLQTILASVSVFGLILMQAFVQLSLLYGYTVHILSPNIILLFGIIVAILVGFYLYIKSLEKKFKLQQEEAEAKNFHHYIQQIEQQHASMRKFKHDYQNILLSLESYLDDDDLDGLKNYYSQKIKPASDDITKSDFALEALSKIKVKEIKSILVSKLMMAQNLGIATTFESDEEIEHIPMDSVALVRMIGIIMDNAIEELEILGDGKLSVASFYIEGGGMCFIAQNSCRADTPPIHKLKQLGFSTKGEGRGTGLENLSQIVAHHPNVTLLTSIVEGNFIQKIVIEDES